MLSKKSKIERSQKSRNVDFWTKTKGAQFALDLRH